MLLLFQAQQVNVLKNREKLLQQLESKYVSQIHALLQQKILISATITKQHDEMVRKINHKIYDYINNQIQSTESPIPNTINTTSINPQLNLPTLEQDITSQSNDSSSNLMENQNLTHSHSFNESNNIDYVSKEQIKDKQKKHQCNSVAKQKYHLTMFTGEKPYKCNECNKSFGLPHHLKNHINQIHTHNGKYLCSYCSKRFTISYDLKRHIRIHTKEKPFKCEDCNKKYRQKKDLTIHQRTHSNGRPFKCNDCNKGFYQRSVLKKHFKIFHSEDKPFKCNKCNKSFVDKSDLRRHIRIHTGEKPYKCKHCNKQFTQAGTRNTHQKKSCKNRHSKM